MRTFLSNPIRIALFFIFGIVGIHILLFLGHQYLTGFPAELCAKIQGFSITPFFMEGSFVAFGLMAVMIINNIRRKWDGEEMVNLEVDDSLVEELKDKRALTVAEKEELISSAIEASEFDSAQEIIDSLTEEQKGTHRIQSLVHQLAQAQEA